MLASGRPDILIFDICSIFLPHQESGHSRSSRMDVANDNCIHAYRLSECGSFALDCESFDPFPQYSTDFVDALFLSY
jgi:hypothetical protein